MQSIHLGLMPPLTGLVALYGPEIVWAAQIACDEINERGGVLGRPLKLIIEDDGSLPDTAVPAAQRLIDTHGCVALIGNLLSNSRIAVAAQVAEPRRIPLLNFSFYEGSISGRYFFHFAALPNQQIDKMIHFMAQRFGLKMFFAGNNYEWPRGSIDAAKLALAQLGGTLVGEEYLDIGADPADIDRLLAQVARSGADVFVPYFAGSDQVALLTRFSALGLKARMAVVMGHYDEMMVGQLPPEVREGFYSSNSYFMSLDTAENQHYLRRLALHSGIDGIWPRGNGVLTNFGEGAYVCVHAFANAAEMAGTLEAEALVNMLELVRVISPQGMVEMDRDTHHASVNTFLSCCQADGTFNIVEHFGLNRPRIPKRYLAQMRSARLHESSPSPEVTARLAAQVGAAVHKLGTAQHILSIADLAVLATDAEGNITETNRGAAQMFGYTESELLGLSVHLLLPPHFRLRHAALLRQFVAGVDTERRMAGRSEVMGYRKDGSFFPVEASIAKVRVEGDWLLAVTMRDLTERKKAEDDLTRRATHDPLTGLPNRALIRERLTTAMQHSRRSGISVALLFIDLDGFKLVNDTYGHDAGDAVLKAVTAKLIEQVRPGDTVARLAGDEFVVLCEQVEQPTAMSVLAERINDVMRLPIDFDGVALTVTASIGVAIGSGSTHACDDLLRSADTAMYAVKEKGGDGWQFFNESLQEKARLRLSITNGLRNAVERNELSVRFQPIVAADSGRIMGAELLMRWHPPEGEISPAIFIPIAEMTGSIVPIGTWVFQQACRAEAAWRQRWGEQAPYISVNLSARQLDAATLVDEFAAIMAESGVDPARLLLEITETALMADVETNLRVLRRLADLGLRVAVDDFGTGYSSLAQLTRLPVDVLKIDRAFVDGIEKSPENRAVIRAVIGLGRALGLKLVAEGVENAAQRRELCALGCDFIQGYYFHRPMTEPDFIDTLEREQHELLPADQVGLYFAIYVSQAVQLPSQSPETIMQAARTANLANGISGCLIVQDGCFMQMLEGERTAVLALLDKIRADPRHSDVHIVIQGPAKRRVFAEWGMERRGLTQGVPGIGDPGDIDFAPWQQRPISLLDLGQDARTSYAYITGYAGGQPRLN